MSLQAGPTAGAAAGPTAVAVTGPTAGPTGKVSRWALPALAIAQVAGILLADVQWLGRRPALALGVAAVVAGLAARRSPPLRAVCAVGVFVALGAHGLAMRLEAADRAGDRPFDAAMAGWVCATEARTASLVVEICDAVRVDFGAPSAALDASALDPGRGDPGRADPGGADPGRGDPGRADPRAVDARPADVTRFQLVAWRATPEAGTLGGLERGQAVRLRVAFRPPFGLSNPGAGDPAHVLRRRGLGARARLVDESLLVRIPARDREPLLGAVLRVRRTIGDRLGGAGPGGALLRALATGDRSELAADQNDAFARLGITHLLSVSGLHLALAAALAFAVLRAALVQIPRVAERWDTRLLALPGAALAALAYALIAGWGVPVQRSLVFVVVAVFRFVAARGAAGPHALAAASIAVLVADPAALFAPGAQLSFVATAALLATAGLDRGDARNRRRRTVEFLRSGLRVSAAATAATAPLLAWHGLTVSLFGLLGNAVAVPWTAFVLLPAALVAAASVAGPLPDAVSGALVAVAEALARISLFAVAAGARAAAGASAAACGSAADVSAPGMSAPVAGWVIAVAGAAAVVAARTKSTVRLVAIAVIVPIGLRLAPPPDAPPEPPKFIVFDVGKGDALLLQGRHGTLLIDGGWATPSPPTAHRDLGGDPRAGPPIGADLGRTAVLPALRALGIDQLDVMVVSHADLDHRGGLATILAALPVRELWIPFGGALEPDFAPLLGVAARCGVVVRERGSGSATSHFGDIALTPLWPPRIADVRSSRNDRSLVVRAEIAGIRVLATGDIGRDAERRLLDLAPSSALRADVLKLAHHGSRSSSSGDFLDAVAPDIAIASAPCGAKGGLPTVEALDRVRARGAAVWWTGRDGAVTVSWSSRAPLVVYGREPLDRCRLE